MTKPITLEQVLELARQLPSSEQARLRVALSEIEESARQMQLERNRNAIALLDAWTMIVAEDDGSESWDNMLRDLDAHRESERELYPDLHQGDMEST